MRKNTRAILLAMIAMVITFVAVPITNRAAQQQSNAERRTQLVKPQKDRTPDSDTDSKRLDRPNDLNSLRDFVSQMFKGAVDPASVSETTAEGHPAITFSTRQKESITDYLLIDFGTHLALNYTTLPTKADEPISDDPKDDQEQVRALKEGGLGIAAATASTDSCGGVYALGDPYACCSNGNCTWAAWANAQRFWKVNLPAWSGNARYWADRARSAGMSVAPTGGVGLYTIGVNSTAKTKDGTVTGHVAWPIEIANNQVLVYEQNWCETAPGMKQKWYSIAFFDQGFILSNSNAPNPTIYRMRYPSQLYTSTYATQTVQFDVANVNPGCRAVVIFPNGGRATLKDGQLSVSNGVLTAYMVLGAAGTWSIQIFNENGKFSALNYFQVR